MLPTTSDAGLNTLKGKCSALLRPDRALMLTILILTLGFPFEDILRERGIYRYGLKLDFTSYYSGGVEARKSGEHHLYDALLKQPASSAWWNDSPFTTPPFSAIVLEPLTILPMLRSYMVWRYALFLMTALSVYWMLQIGSSEGVSLTVLAVGVAAAFAFHPFQYTAYLGNIDGIMLFTWTLGLYLFARGRPVASAFAFAFGSLVKLAPLIAVPLFVLRKQWRWLGAYTAWMLALTGISVWRLGWQPHLEWLRAVYPIISHGGKSFYNRGLLGLILWCSPGQVWGRYGSLGWEAKVPAIVLCLAFFLWCWKKGAGQRGLVHELALAPLIYLLVSPLAWDAHYILALIPLVYLWMKFQDTRVGASPGQIAILTGSTLLFGVTAPSHLAGGLNSFVVFLFLLSL